jgi:pimeloyl-ACP methyl ester carboxylesterase
VACLLTARKKLTFALTGGALLAAGILLLAIQPYRAKTVLASAGGCAMRVDIVEPVSGEAQGYVVLFHGLSATKRIMWYLAEGFANQNLRVFLPDFPGHGRTPGPFSPARAESCADSLVRELIDRSAIVPQRTILAGHSMGGAIAIRLASRIPVAGVIAISPAPMGSSPGVSPEMLLFPHAVPLPPHSLVINGAWEPSTMRESAHGLVQSQNNGTSEYRVLSHATHVSLIFDSSTIREEQRWASQLLGVNADARIPSHASVYGVLFGIAGLAILVVPFLVETVALPHSDASEDPIAPLAPAHSLLQVTLVCAAALALLHFGVPLRFLHLFQDDYLASFFFLAGLGLLLWNWKRIAGSLRFSWRPILAAAFAAIALILLFGGWLDLTFYEAWLTLPRWLRFPGFFLAVLPWQFAEELLLGSWGALARWKRFVLSLSFRAIAWLAMSAGLFYLHSGEILIVLLAAYFAVFFVLQRLAVDVVHRESRSAAAAAVFGAILFAGLALAIFPVA